MLLNYLKVYENPRETEKGENMSLETTQYGPTSSFSVQHLARYFKGKRGRLFERTQTIALCKG